MKSDHYKSMLELVLNNIHEGVVLCDPKGKILFFNRIYEEIFNLQSDRDIGKNIRDLFPDARIPVVGRTGIPEFGMIYHWKGQKLVVNRIPVKEESTVIGVVTQVLFRDIQELRELTEKVSFLKTKISSMGAEFRQTFQAKYSLEDIVGESQQIRRLKDQIIKHSNSSLPVLILGESGTGKELFAHALHRMSPRSQRAFIVINCAAIPKDLMESELFGYEPGAFTGAAQKGRIGKFELVEGGTIFFDEIGDMPLEMQAKILRVIEEKEVTKLGGSKPVPVEFSFIAATNQDIETQVHSGVFRSDLLYRINAFVLRVPPLRERKEDILPLASHLAKSFECNPSGKAIRLSEEVAIAFMEYDWPGNVRELKNIVNFSVHNLTRDEDLVRLNHLPISFFARKQKHSSIPCSRTLKDARRLSEKEVIHEALRSTSGNKAAAAKLLNISRSVFYEKLKRYDLLS